MNFTDSVIYITDKIKQILTETEFSEVESVVTTLLDANKVFVYGVGRSGHVGKGFAMRLVQLGLAAYFIGETITPIVEHKDTVVLISNTGETMSAIQTGNIARRQGAKVIVVTSDRNSKLAKTANLVIGLPVNRNSDRTELAPLGTLFEDSALILLDSLVSEMMVRLGETEESMRARHSIMV